ncbi:MAG: GAF domain-containing sensor histidine kinase, partial [bacterium]
STLPFAEAIYYPLLTADEAVGVIGIAPLLSRPLTLEQEGLLQTFLHQIAVAIEREMLHAAAEQAHLLAESERLYKTLFNSISHELRTPISAIMSASESLLHAGASQRPEIKTELAKEIHWAAERLNRLIENLLDMTRLESGLIQPKRDWCDVHDLINTAVKKLGAELTGHSLSVSVSPDMPLLKIDFGLMEQALANLLHNAAVYTPAGSTIQICALAQDENGVITIADNGPGLPAEALSRVFEKFYRVRSAKAGGLGLGLSIARGFVEAHKGTIAVENRAEGGAQFTIRLPLELQNVNVQ